MIKKYLELLEHNLNWVKRQIREDERMKDLRFAREICNSHKYRVVGALELMLDMKEITWEKEHEEEKKWTSCLGLKICLKKLRKRERNELEQKKSTTEVGET